MAAEIEERLSEESELIKSSGGIFEVEDRGALLFSKKELNRFPQDQEIFEIINGVEKGLELEEAKARARQNIPEPISFSGWLKQLLQKRQT